MEREKPYGTPVPSGRPARLWRLGSLAGGVARSALQDGLRDAVRGRRPDPRALLLTPGNLTRVATELAKMRGAAMKVGQLVSMDAGDLMPPEFAVILDRLRAQAEPMPPKQLRDVLDREWGPNWLRRFERFDVRPIAAASIGQVHRARTQDGRELALKVQYPGVRESIDSDIVNISGLLRWSGAVPSGMDLTPLLDEARRQLHEEADYEREGASLDLFGAHLREDTGFVVPKRHSDLSTRNVLAMDFVHGFPIEKMNSAPQEQRDLIAERLIDLVLKELFRFNAMQTDPNFANYLVEPETGRIVLLDFGAVRHLPAQTVAGFRDLTAAGRFSDRDGADRAMRAVGLMGPATSDRQRGAILDMFDLAMEPIRRAGTFDFATTDLAARLRDMGLDLGAEREVAQVPPGDTLLIQRKVAGTYLLCVRLGARVDLSKIVARFDVGPHD